MSEKKTETLVICKLSNCYYWEPANVEGRAICTHPDKAMYLRTDPCPLYRLDWKRKRNPLG